MTLSHYIHLKSDTNFALWKKYLRFSIKDLQILCENGNSLPFLPIGPWGWSFDPGKVNGTFAQVFH